MVINEKALVAQMKSTYKTYGYTVAVDEDVVYLTNGFWMAGMDIDQVPSEIMGMFGEHIRAIPRSGDAYKVIKDKDGPVVQHRLLEETMGPVEQIQQLRAKAFPDPMPMCRTNLTYGGLQVWQKKFGYDIFLIDPRFAVMVEKNREVFQVGEGIYAEDEESKLWVLRVNDKTDKTYIDHMEKIQWIKE